MDLQSMWNGQRWCETDLNELSLQTPDDHYLAPMGYLSSAEKRAELQRGTVDFLVPSTYWAPVPPKRLIHSFVPLTEDSGTTGRPSLDTKPSLLPPLKSAETATRKPAPMNYVFALDVSLEAVQGGLLRSACDILLDILYGSRVAEGTTDGEAGAGESTRLSWWNPESKLAILTYDRELCFYDFSVS